MHQTRMSRRWGSNGLREGLRLGVPEAGEGCGRRDLANAAACQVAIPVPRCVGDTAVPAAHTDKV